MAAVSDELLELLTAPNALYTAGLELLDLNNQVVEDITDSLVVEGSEVEYHYDADVHRTCQINITRKLAWGRDRVRPYIVVSAGSVVQRFDLGIFTLVTPKSNRGEKPQTWAVAGYDLMQLLLDGPGDTWVVDFGTSFLGAIREVVASAGLNSTVFLSGDRAASTSEKPYVWIPTDQTPVRWLDIINDLLHEIGYAPMWADGTGALRSGPLVDPKSQPPLWVFDVTNQTIDLAALARSVNGDMWAAYNWWRFIRSDMDTSPVEGDGIYTYVNQSDGPSSVDQLGRYRRKDPQTLQVVDQAALVAQGDAIVAADRQVTATVELSVDPLPIAGHQDVAQLIDGDATEDGQERTSLLCLVQQWTVTLDGSPGAWVLEVLGDG